MATTTANPQPVPTNTVKCGGPTEARQLENDDKALFEKYRDIIQQKVHEQFQVPNDFKLEPSKVRTQVVAGVNYIFHVSLPNNENAQVKVFQPLKGHALASGDPASFVTVTKE